MRHKPAYLNLGKSWQKIRGQSSKIMAPKHRGIHNFVRIKNVLGKELASELYISMQMIQMIKKTLTLPIMNQIRDRVSTKKNRITERQDKQANELKIQINLNNSTKLLNVERSTILVSKGKILYKDSRK